MHSPITQDQVKELLNYDADTGLFTYKQGSSKRNAGDVAGYSVNGSHVIKVDGAPYQARTIAWLYIHGEFERKVTPKDGNKGNAASNNLKIIYPSPKSVRAAARREEIRIEELDGKNIKYPADYEGAYMDDNLTIKPWRCRVMINGEPMYSGRFNTLGECKSGYRELRKTLDNAAATR